MLLCNRHQIKLAIFVNIVLYIKTIDYQILKYTQPVTRNRSLPQKFLSLPPN